MLPFAVSTAATCYADRVCGQCIKMVPCLSVRPSVPGERARQQESRAAAGDAHRRLRMTHAGRVNNNNNNNKQICIAP